MMTKTISENILDVERNIDHLLSTGFGAKHNVTTAVAQIPELDYNEYDALNADLISGKVIVRQAPGGPMRILFTLFATKTQSTVFDMLAIASFALPLAGIALGIFVSWWWLLLVLAPMVTMSLSKRVYLAALFGPIGSSEKAFCFAFCAKAITVELRDGKICYRGMGKAKN
jgi:hypothetical protein